MLNGIVNCVIVNIAFSAMPVLDLDRCDNTLLTEGSFIPSATAGINLWRKI